VCSCTSSALVKLRTVTATLSRVMGDLQYGVFERLFLSATLHWE
jgi:hypothetical protein